MKRIALSLLLAILPLALFGASGTAIPGGNQAAPYIINKPGAYYLAANRTLTDNSAAAAIEIQADNVTLDLNGFVVGFTENGDNAGSGGNVIVVSGDNVEVRNGGISSAPGYAVFGDVYGFRLIDVRVLGTKGVYLTGAGGLVERCQITSARRFGVYLAGAGSIVKDCFVTDVTKVGADGIGIYLGEDVQALDCSVSHTDFHGIEARRGALVSGCRVSHCNVASDPLGAGISLSESASTARDNIVNSCSGTGIRVGQFSLRAVVEKNRVSRTFMIGGSGGNGILSAVASAIVRDNVGTTNQGGLLAGSFVNGGGNIGE
jgi:hypothetical protein